ncbi:hypothetical protein PAXINDRAFT_101727 [Paxillus involutus ATCC 200175]|uniref:Uncharacterized protein n=1 Tax=Paxillus involutus ATCC 200175 TaxID=664439 RepID=A0A0C9T6D5_PAXIN|nr:hypothetical protein PAXINDRAFT_101727 [Paxillus involutus ATCC 200175]
MHGEGSYSARYAHLSIEVHGLDRNFSASHHAPRQQITVPPKSELVNEGGIRSGAHPSYGLPGADINSPFWGEASQEVPSWAGDPVEFSFDNVSSVHREDTIFPSNDYPSTTYSGSGIPEGITAHHRDRSDLPLSFYSELSGALGTNPPSRPGPSGSGSLQQFGSVRPTSIFVSRMVHMGGKALKANTLAM